MLKFIDDTLYDYLPLITEITPELKHNIKQVTDLLLSDDFYLGVAANQVGLSERFFAMRTDKGSDKVVVCINPTFIPSIDSTIVQKEEICLSFPDEWDSSTKSGYAETLRYESIITCYMDQKGRTIRTTMKGLAALIFQHETDHLNGVTVY